MTYDCVVVGAGNAALCAAITAAEYGARVLVIERAPQTKRGGNSWFSDGAIRFAHRGFREIRPLLQDMSEADAERVEIPPYDTQTFIADLERMSDGKADSTLIHLLASQSMQTMQWLRDEGVPFTLIVDNQAFEVDGRFKFWGGLSVRVEGKGVGLMAALNRRVESLGIECWYDAHAHALERLDDDLVVVVSRADRDELVRASTVILASGSFEANEDERVRQLGPEWDRAVVRGTEYNTGDGLRMALQLGAVRYGDWEGCHAVATDANAPPVGDFSRPGDIFKKHSYPLGVVVNNAGKRFIDEGADFRNYTYARYGKEVLKQPGGIAYQIFDAQVSARLRSEYAIPDVTRYEASTLEALAKQIGLDSAQFINTIHEFNASVGAGAYNPERLDGKSTVRIIPPKSNWALPINQPPFLAFPVTCGITFTFGGIQVDDHARVLDGSGNPIPGLYAAGEMVGGLFYGNYAGGAGLMSGATFGRIAGRQAALQNIAQQHFPQKDR